MVIRSFWSATAMSADWSEIHLREEMKLECPLVSIDGLELKEFDYIDIDRIRAGEALTCGRREHIMNTCSRHPWLKEMKAFLPPDRPDPVPLNAKADVTFTVTVTFRINPWNP